MGIVHRGHVAARLACAALLLTLSLAGRASAAPARAAAPAVADVVRAWTIAREWLDRFSLPREHEQAAAVAIPNASGISVLLRARGQIVGRGEIAPADGLALRRAMSRAMGEALGGGLRAMIEAEGDGVGRKLTLEIEVAGEPTPLIGRSFADASQRVRFGIDGLAMRRDETWSFAYPGRLLATNMAGNVGGAFAGLAAELGLPTRDLPELKRAGDVAIYRFETVRLVQLRPGEVPTALLRNDLLVPDSAVTRTSTALLASAIAHRLVRAVHAIESEKAGGSPTGAPSGSSLGSLFQGDYAPAADERRPPIAPAFEQALCCLALLRFSESGAMVATLGDEVAVIIGESRNTAMLVLEALSRGSSIIGEPFEDRRAAAAVVLAISQIPARERPPWTSALREWAMQRVDEGYEPARGFIGPDGVPLPAHAQALLAAARAAVAGESREASAIDSARRALESAWRAASDSQRAAQMPWLVWAERDVLALRPGDESSPLLLLREQLLATQLGFTDAVELSFANADLRGGFALSGTAAITDAQSARPAAGLAAMLVDDAMTPPAVRSVLLARQRAANRFLMQLTIRAPLDRLYRRPETVIGGIRNSPWDSIQAVAAQAMAILALVDSLPAFPAESADSTAPPTTASPQP